MVNSVGILSLRSDVMLPEYGTRLSACADIRANFSDLEEVNAIDPDNNVRELRVQVDGHLRWVNIPSGWRVLVTTGFALDIPEGFSVRTHPRSGLSYKCGLVVVCGEGVIDEYYQKELMVPIINFSDVTQSIFNGDRIAQMELVKDIRATFDFVDALSEKDSLRNGGFGHTGTS